VTARFRASNLFQRRQPSKNRCPFEVGSEGSHYLSRESGCSSGLFATIFLGLLAPDFLDDEGFARRLLQPSLLVGRLDPEPTCDRTKLLLVFDRMKNSKLSLNGTAHGISLTTEK
jgi:hypothetical protein